MKNRFASIFHNDVLIKNDHDVSCRYDVFYWQNKNLTFFIDHVYLLTETTLIKKTLELSIQIRFCSILWAAIKQHIQLHSLRAMKLNFENENQFSQFDLLIHANVMMSIRASFLTSSSCFARFMCRLTDYDVDHDVVDVKKKIDVSFIFFNDVFIHMFNKFCFWFTTARSRNSKIYIFFWIKIRSLTKLLKCFSFTCNNRTTTICDIVCISFQTRKIVDSVKVYEKLLKLNFCFYNIDNKSSQKQSRALIANDNARIKLSESMRIDSSIFTTSFVFSFKIFRIAKKTSSDKNVSKLSNDLNDFFVESFNIKNDSENCHDFFSQFIDLTQKSRENFVLSKFQQLMQNIFEQKIETSIEMLENKIESIVFINVTKRDKRKTI